MELEIRTLTCSVHGYQAGTEVLKGCSYIHENPCTALSISTCDVYMY